MSKFNPIVTSTSAFTRDNLYQIVHDYGDYWGIRRVMEVMGGYSFVGDPFYSRKVNVKRAP